VRYWDSSALVALVVDEPGTALVRRWLREDTRIVTWALSRLEIAGAVERRARERRITAAQRRAALRRFDELAATWGEVSDLLAVRSRALALLGRHPLRAADAAQLGAALLVAEGEPASLQLVCLDRSVAAAAEREGFPVLTWPDDDTEGSVRG
jgi:hypothetical protein